MGCELSFVASLNPLSIIWLVKLITGGKCCYNTKALEMVGMASSLKLRTGKRKAIANNGTIIMCWHLISRNKWSGFLTWLVSFEFEAGLQYGHDLWKRRAPKLRPWVGGNLVVGK